MDRNGWFKREVEIEAALEERVDELFGEDFLFSVDRITERVVTIELLDYLGIEEPSKDDVGAQIDYVRTRRRLKRFRKEETFRLLLEANWLLAYRKNGEDPTEEDLRSNAQILKKALIEVDEFEIRKDLDKKYGGE
ncbi:Uncharacterised protein [uncultured archaeon]|nr:Uncharacterised protein [uncultured archaeon]